MRLHKFLVLLVLLLCFPQQILAAGPIPVASYLSAGKRDVATNENILANTYVQTSPNRVYNIAKKRYLAPNANWRNFQITVANWTKGPTAESASYPTRVIKRGLLIDGTFYPVTWNNGQSTAVLTGGNSITSDVIKTPWIQGGREIEIRSKDILPLLFNTQTANFSVGDTITGATSGVTATVVSQVDNGATGSLVLSNETGQWTAGELITSNTGGSATVDFTTNQQVITGYGSLAHFLEGALSGQNPTVDYTGSNLPSIRMVLGNPTISGGSITAVQVLTSGVGYSSASSIYAYELGPDNVIYSKNVGNTNSAHTTATITAGSPPTGLAAWSSPSFAVTGGGDFGTTTAIYDTSLITAIPDHQTQSVMLDADSIGRGYTSADGVGDLNHSFGVVPRLIAKRVGSINISTSGAAFGNEVQYGTTFARSYGLYAGKTSHVLIGLGSNDVVAGTSKTTITNNANNLANYLRSFGSKVAFSTVIPRESASNITGITQANPAVVTVSNSFAIGDTVYFGKTDLGTDVGGMTQIRTLTGTLSAANGTSVTVGIDSSAFSAYTSGGGLFSVTPAHQKAATGFSVSGVGDQLNTDIMNNTIVSDFSYFNMRPFFQDGTYTSAWRSDISGITADWVHPSPIGISAAANDNTLQTYWKSFGRNQMSVTYNIVIEKYASFVLNFTLKENELATDLTGYTAQMEVRSSFSDDTVLLVASTANGKITLGGTSGTVQVIIPPDETGALAVTSAVYDILLESPTGIVRRRLQGKVKVDPGVTRSVP